MFGFLKKGRRAPGTPKTPSASQKDPLLEEIRTAYHLQWQESDNPMISGSTFGHVWKGQSSSCPFHIRIFDSRQWELWAGGPDEIIDLEIQHYPDGNAEAAPNHSVEDCHLSKQLPTSLASRYIITEQGSDEDDSSGPQLHDPVIQRAMQKFSNSVLSVVLYPRSVELSLGRENMTRSAFDTDLTCAGDIVSALQQRNPA